MECLLPSTAFDKDKSEAVDESGDSTKCVESNQLNSSCGSICDISTPICNNDDDKPASFGNKISSVTTDCTSLKKAENDSGSSEVKNDVVDIGSKSPGLNESLKKLKKQGGSFALDDSLSSVSFMDSDFAACVDPLESMDYVESEAKANETRTPIKSLTSPGRELELFREDYTHFERPHVKISDIEFKKPVVDNSVASFAESDLDVPPEILSVPRCWTDRFENEVFEDSISASQSPVRSLASLINSSQNDISGSSVRRFNYGVDVTPIRSYSRSISRVGKNLHNFESFDNFASDNIEDMCKMASNPMYNVSLSYEEIGRIKLPDVFNIMYKQFKNMCTIVQRSTIRNEKSYFRVVKMYLQRITRRTFKMDNLLQMVWLAPNLVNIKWVTITGETLKKYSFEYKDSTTKAYDLSIKILRPDLVSCSTTADYEVACFMFKNILCTWTLKCECDRMDKIPVPIAKLPPRNTRSNSSTPLRLGSSFSTPRKFIDSLGTPHRLSNSQLSSMLLDDSQITPIRPLLQRTPTRSLLSQRYSSRPLVSERYSSRSLSQLTPMKLDGTTPVRPNDKTEEEMNKTPVRSLLRSVMYDFLDDTPNKSYKITGANSVTRSSKRAKTMDMVSPMCPDLLETPGMRRIRENAKQREIQKKTNMERDKDLAFWNDMKWFIKVLLEIIVGDMSPDIKIEFFVDFMKKYGTRKPTQDQVSKWIDALIEIDPVIISKSVSKLDNNTTIVTINKSASLDKAIDYVDQKINTFKTA
ncbi:uncharacterized protein TOT_020000436 [Theileria orientalis strain Shintoku]|uniref:CDT1 Geminin-binding domain-containing protein n=1 Tax=Theileria orientalis strain Shintoku TaxID=869250 RepID=J4DP66_THEOR|nr:uncharacterized protein TOT_020000436 [Theileria orientalis strain Shintoku]BAM40174.1 uncharacterized protein TOT_020000436 [Theileria orientalis strain Shintoku]|eukprot:XP_009690475.1 uncharacterized protein TOT_020000436 [Theileria orientalis strain Shintoku]